MKKKYKKKSPAFVIFIVLIFTALTIVTILEYLDFKKGKESFIFTKLLHLPKVPSKKLSFTAHLLRVFKDNGIKHETIQKKGQLHIKSHILAGQKEELMNKINEISLKMGRGLRLAEIKKVNSRIIHLYEIYHGRTISHLLLISLKSNLKKEGILINAEPVKKKLSLKPKLAFIIDDIGYTRDISLELKNLNIPITASIIPDAPYAMEEGIKLKNYKLEQIIHLPMQSKKMPFKFKGKDFITVHSTYDEIKDIIGKAKKKIPGSKGLNNHMGSLVTANKTIMKTILEVIKEENLFFIDSKTAVNTVAYTLAKNMGIRTTSRDIFLDHVQTYSHTMYQIQNLVEISLKKGKALAIGHPFGSTLKAIKDSQKYIKAKGVQIVFASSLLE